MKIKILLSIAIISVLFSCKSEKQRLTEQIQLNEEKLFNDSTKMLNVQIANDELMAYQKYASTFPDDSISPTYLFKAADLAHGLRKNREAIEIYRTLLAKYPTHPKAASSLFLSAFIFDSDLQQKDSAKVIYKEFLNKYPDHVLASSAKGSLDQIEAGRTDEEQVNEFISRLDSAKKK